MDVSVVVPIRIRGNKLPALTPSVSSIRPWPGVNLQVHCIACGDSNGADLVAEMLAASSPPDLPSGIPATPDDSFQITTSATAATEPIEVLRAALTQCTGQVVVWFGGLGCPIPAIRWLAEATSRFDYVSAQPRRDTWTRTWSRLARIPRRLWSGPTPKQPEIQLFAALADALHEPRLDGLGICQLPNALKREGYRVGELITPPFAPRNQLNDRRLAPWKRLRQASRPTTPAPTETLPRIHSPSVEPHSHTVAPPQTPTVRHRRAG